MVLHTENVDNVDNFVNNYRLSKFSRILNVDNFVIMLGEIFDNFFSSFTSFGLCLLRVILRGSSHKILLYNFFAEVFFREKKKTGACCPRDRKLRLSPALSPGRRLRESRQEALAET